MHKYKTTVLTSGTKVKLFSHQELEMVPILTAEILLTTDGSYNVEIDTLLSKDEDKRFMAFDAILVSSYIQGLAEYFAGSVTGSLQVWSALEEIKANLG